MATRSAPWQYEWKRPEWQSSIDDNDEEAFSVDGIPVSSASVEISPRELQEWQNTQDSFSWKDDEASLLLSATLYSTAGDQKSVADVLVLELIQYTREGAKRVKYRMLRWPSSAMNEEEEKKSWWGSKKPTLQVGLACVTLCRLPPGQDLAATSADAMDVVTLLSLGLDTSESPSVPQNIVDESSTEEPQTTSKEEELTDLIMTCLTTDGRVLFYSPQQIFQPNKSEEDSQNLENGLADLFLGNAIHQQLEQSVLPLSQPLAIVKLSVPLQRPKSTTKPKHDKLDVIPEDLELPEDEVYEEEEDSTVKQDLWEGSFWDANVVCAKYHTVDNVPKLMIPAFDFVVVAGHGTRIRRIRRRKKTVSASRGSSVSSWETASQADEEKWELSAKTRSNTTDSIDSKEGWWQESQVETPPLDDDASNQTKKRQDRAKIKWIEYKESGGFVTFISLRYYAESRTVYLPFAPKQLSSIIWGGMHFVIVLGEETLAPIHAPLAMAIRVDSFDFRSVPLGEAPSFVSSNSFGDVDKMKSSPADKKKSKRKQVCSVRRFRLISILLPSKGSTSSEQVTAVAVSSSVTAPPAIVLQYSSAPEMSGDLIVTLNSLKALDVVPTILTHRATGGYRRFGNESEKALAIRTHLELGHVARIPHTAEPSTTRNTWCRVGQGWSVYGVDGEVFFICWEGATASQGSFVSKIHSEEEYESKVDALTTLRLFAPVVSDVLPLRSLTVNNATQIGPEITKTGRRTSYLQLPFTSPYKMPSFAMKQEAPGTILENVGVEDVVKDALDSLAIADVSSEMPERASRVRRPSLSYRERSVRLVRHCSSWIWLDDTKENKTYYDSQVPVMMVQLGPLPREHFILSLRKVVVDSEVASPFNQVLGWLSQSKDYFTAASVALDLLHDVDSLRDLRRAKEEGVGMDNERANLEGLLDGIVPLYTDDENAPSDSVLTQLADMSVGCLLKGGLSMSSTLENFVQNNPNYDPGRACLMLVSAAVCSLSRDPKTVKSVMGADYEWPDDDKAKADDLLWPLRSLFRVGVARNYLSTILLLLNAAIPEEIRNSGDDGARASSPVSLEICRAIVSMIVSSSAADLMLDLKDETTGKRYWTSLDHETRLDLSLLSIDDKFPLLRQAEVRLWALEEMDETITSNGGSPEGLDSSDVPNSWLRILCEACMVNAGCDLDYVTSESFLAAEPDSDNEKHDDDDGTLKHFETNRLAIEALTPSPGSGGLDFDLMIPALLLLANRSVAWRDNTCLSTQNVLDAACYLAGRHRKEEPAFPFDGPTVMKQCAKSGNISAGANLIGGKNGLVLKCCDILISGAGTNMDDAEDYILNDALDDTKLWTKAKHDTKKMPNKTAFELTDQHRSVLWLLDEYVLSIKTYGDFDTAHNRGKIDPVFAARSCFRTWYLLSLRYTTEATAWLVKWLRVRLDMKPDRVSPKRLACSALTCALMWPATDEMVDVGELDEASDETLLSTVLDMEGLFLVQLSQSCCGLVEAVPPSLALEILRESEAQEMRTSSSSLQVLDV